MAKSSGSYATLSSATGAYPRSARLKVSAPDTKQESLFYYGAAIFVGFCLETIIMLVTGM